VEDRGKLLILSYPRPHASCCFHHSKITTDRKRIFTTILYFIAYRVLLLLPPTMAHISSHFSSFCDLQSIKMSYFRLERAVFFISLPPSHSIVYSLLPLLFSNPCGPFLFHINVMTHHGACLRKSVSWSFVHVISSNDKFLIYRVFFTSDEEENTFCDV
jgi:hypothetical protein